MRRNLSNVFKVLFALVIIFSGFLTNTKSPIIQAANLDNTTSYEDANNRYYANDKSKMLKVIAQDNPNKVVEVASFCLDYNRLDPDYYADGTHRGEFTLIKNPTTEQFGEAMATQHGGQGGRQRWDTATVYEFVKRAMYVYVKDPTNIQDRYGLRVNNGFPFWAVISDVIYYATNSQNYTNWGNSRQNGARDEIIALVNNPNLIPDNEEVEFRLYKADWQTGRGIQSLASLRVVEKPQTKEVKFSKRNIGGEEIAGAQIQILKDGNVVESWTSEEGKTHELSLLPGDYTFHEEVAPQGYYKVTDINFTVGDDGNIVVKSKGDNDTVDVDGNILKVTDQKAGKDVEISKVDLGGKEIAGAQIQILVGGIPVRSWTSEEGKTHKLVLPANQYTFREISAPTGYAKVTDIIFTVDRDGKVTLDEVNGNKVKVENDNKLVVTDEELYKNPEGKINTTVSANDKDSSAQTSTKVTGEEVAKGVKVVDKINYEKLVPNKEYEVSGELYEVANGQTVGAAKSTANATFTTSNDGNGTWSLDFGTLTNLEVNKSYVVYETATSKEDLVNTDDDNKPDSKHKVEHKNANDISQTFTTVKDQPKEVEFSKVDQNDKLVEGARVYLYKAQNRVKGAQVERWNTLDRNTKIFLEKGEYILEEVNVPYGHDKFTDVNFEVTDDGLKILSTHSENAPRVDGYKLLVIDFDRTKEVNFSKVNLGGVEIAGAQIQIKQGDTVVKSWTSEENKTYTTKLLPGEYTFHEEVAPNGYFKVTDITFEVTNDGKITVKNVNGNKVEATDNKLTVTDKDTATVKFSKKALSKDGEELAGATIEVQNRDKNNEVVKTWVSDGKVKEFELKQGNYRFVETKAPTGYELATSIDFSVESDGSVKVGDTKVEGNAPIVMVDNYAPQGIVVSKVDLGGKEIPGARIHVKQGDKLIDQWWSLENRSTILYLLPGTYTFHEEAAPNGYEKVTDITFEVTKDGKVEVKEVNGNVKTDDNKLIVTDDYSPHKVKFSKKALTENGEELAGATIQVQNRDKNNEVVQTWVSDGTVKEFELKPGNYKFVEKAAPQGYQLATTISFSVDKDGTIKVGDAKVSGDAPIVMVDKLVPYENPKGELRTTVAANGNSSTDEKSVEVTLENNSNVKVVDTVYYNGLVKEKEYTVTGELYEVANGQIIGAAKATKEETKVASESGEGNWEIDFGEVNLEVGKTYVVYETATSKEDLVDSNNDNKVDQKHVVAHKNPNDKAQTVVVKEKDYENPKGELRTTVAANGNSSASEKAVEVTIEKDSSEVKVVDTVHYSGLVKEKEYTVTGELYEVANGQIIGAAKATKEETKVASESGEGTWEIDFGGVTLEVGKTYVVYEKATSKEDLVDSNNDNKVDQKHVVVHENPNDKAQTVVVNKPVTPPTPSKTYFSKVNLGGEEIGGASIQILKDGAVVESWTSVAGQTKELSLEEGTYTFHEAAAPEGYEVVTDIVFTVDKDGNVKVESKGETDTAVATGNKLVVTDKDKPTPPPVVPNKVYFSKVNLGGEEIAGASIQILKDGKVVESWTSVANQTKELSLEEGTYTFHEVNAPEGYEVVTDITFTVDKDGKVTVVTKGEGDTVVATGNKLVVTDKDKPTPPPVVPNKVYFSKVNLGGEEIAGAEIQIKQGDTLISSWTSEAGVTKELELEPGEYTFHEVSAPENYLVVTDIVFTVDKDGNVKVVTKGEGDTVVATDNKLVVTDKDKPTPPPVVPNKVYFSKVNLGGDEIAGASIQILKDGEAVASWISEAGVTKELELEPGDYTFHEAVAPEGYLVVTDINFTIDKDYNITVTSKGANDKVEATDNKLVVTDKDKPVVPPTPKNVIISKVNLGGEEIAGASIQILKDGEAVASWISEAGVNKELTLEAGTYTFHEAAAPEGYLVVTDIVFTVDKDGNVKVVTKGEGDAVVATGNKLVVTDKDKPTPPPVVPHKVYFSKVNLGGEEIAGAEIQILKDGKVIASWTSVANQTKELSLEEGTYTFHEVAAPEGYLVVTDIIFTVDKDGKVTVVTKGDGDKVEATDNKLVVTDKDKPTTPPTPPTPETKEEKPKGELSKTGQTVNDITTFILGLAALAGAALLYRRKEN